MKILVTGATAPLGHAIVERLLDQRDVELVLAVGAEREPPHPHHAKLRRQTADLLHPRVLHDLLWSSARELRVDVVIHAMHHRDARDRGTRVHAQNVETTRNLLLACRDHPTLRRLVYRSFAEVYALRHTTSNLLDEDGELDFDPSTTQWVRDRVEADLLVCAEHGPVETAVLRCAEILAPDTGSQLWDYLQSRVCLRPLGFDPMLNVLALDDAADAFVRAARSHATGVFNIPGSDTLPLSAAIENSWRADVPVPGPLLSPLYGLRRWLAGFEFRYDMNLPRFHFGGVLDGSRARRELGYVPHTSVRWPGPWWITLVDALAANHHA
jgi:UDP-glucose 4-epimerase